MSTGVFYKAPSIFPYNGNILIDDISTIEFIDKKNVIEKLDNFSNVMNARTAFPESYFDISEKH